VTAPSWSLAVLAGGLGTRMGSDKGSRPFAGKTLLEHAIGRFAPGGAPLLVSTRPGAEASVPKGATAVPDDVPGLGPLAGIAALVARAPSPFLLVVPVDLPLLPAGCGAAMAAAVGDAAAVVLSFEGRVEPLPVLVSRDLAPLLNDLLRQGLRRADAFHEAARARVVPFETIFPGADPAAAFLNVNAPDDLARAEALLASGLCRW
jgi:molybdopterin-guanine dinucleotide biosynthesis protein A